MASPEYSAGVVGIIDLIDPIARSVATLLVDSRVASYFVEPHSGPGPFQVGFPAVGKPLPARKWQTKTEELGTRVVGGIELEGTRTVQTSDGGQPVIAVHEMWSSRSLGITMAVDARGPGWKHTAKLENLSRHEPDPALFAIPRDYTTQNRQSR